MQPSPAPRILLVEANDDLRGCYRELLELDGYRVDEASTPIEAIERLGDGEAPALVMLCVELGGAHDLPFLNAKRGLDGPGAQVPVVVLCPYFIGPSPGAVERLNPWRGLGDVLRSIARLLRGTP